VTITECLCHEMTDQFEESRSFSPWASSEAPRKILVIRMQAIGDVVITLPACAALRQLFPAARIDLLTSDACAEIPRAIRLFDHVYSATQGTGRWLRVCRALVQGARLNRERYDVVLDLQRHRISRLIRRMARPLAWGEFDRFSPRHALARVVETCQKAGFPGLMPAYGLELKPVLREGALCLLREHGWDGKVKLVMLNPAGLWETRNWPLARYEELARLWSEMEPVRFLFVGTSRIRDKVRYLADRLAGHTIDLTGKTSLAEALGVVQHASVVISEDSGLLHMAWVSGIPTVALFGSTRSDWARPLGNRSRFVGSEDLSCGACMQAACRFGDVHCLTRYSAEEILKLAREAENSI
jgi:heptosyltransferase II